MFQFTNGEEYYNRIYFIFNALIAISLLPFSFILLEMQKDEPNQSLVVGFQSYTLMFSMIILLSYLTFRSFQTLKHFKKTLTASQSLRKKLSSYKFVLTKHYLMLSIFCMIATIILYLTRSNLMVVYYVLLLVLLSINRPTLKLIVKELKLSNDDQEILYQKKEIIED